MRHKLKRDIRINRTRLELYGRYADDMWRALRLLDRANAALVVAPRGTPERQRWLGRRAYATNRVEYLYAKEQWRIKVEAMRA
jgi:hypothetical protein